MKFGDRQNMMNEAIGTGVLDVPDPEKLNNAPYNQCKTNVMHHDVLIDETRIDKESDEVSVQSEENANSEVEMVESDDDVGNFYDNNESELEIVNDED